MEGMHVAEFILERALASGAEEAECSVARKHLTEFDSEAGSIKLARSVASDDIYLKVIVGQKKGTVRLNQRDEESVQKAIADALNAAAESAPDPAEGISDEKENGTFTTGVRETDLNRLYSLLEALIRDTAEAFPLVTFESASIRHTMNDYYYANSNGVRHVDLSGQNMCTTVFSGSRDGKSSSFNYFGIYIPDSCTDLLELDSVRRLLGDAEKQIDTESISNGAIKDIVFSPDCFADLLAYTEMQLLSDLPMISGTTPWKGKLGDRVASSSFTWASSPEDPRLVDRASLTGDGYIAKNHTLIENGVLKNYSLSRYGSKATGETRSGNQHSMYIVEPGDKTFDAIIGGIKRGLLVNRFSGGMPAPNGDFSGVAKNSFLIENGSITKAVTETMIAGNLADLLDNIEALSDTPLGDGARLLPWVHVKGITVSG